MPPSSIYGSILIWKKMLAVWWNILRRWNILLIASIIFYYLDTVWQKSCVWMLILVKGLQQLLKANFSCLWSCLSFHYHAEMILRPKRRLFISRKQFCKGQKKKLVNTTPYSLVAKRCLTTIRKVKGLHSMFWALLRFWNKKWVLLVTSEVTFQIIQNYGNCKGNQLNKETACYTTRFAPSFF